MGHEDVDQTQLIKSVAGTFHPDGRQHERRHRLPTVSRCCSAAPSLADGPYAEVAKNPLVIEAFGT
jgi:hypothetical protein